MACRICIGLRIPIRMTEHIGRFELRRVLGRGAQSVVYLGFDPQLHREVAIKTLHFAQPDQAQNAALLAEARVVGKMRHPNVVPIFDAGEQDGDPYLVFEYVPGKNLADFLSQSGALPPIRAVTIIRPILDALGHAHAQGIIHRDLKPSNILLDEDGTPRVMDFGIAMRLDGVAEARDKISGTPAYMAPEYVLRRELGERSDVFAAGLILYEMLTGKAAYTGATAQQILREVAAHGVVLDEALPIDARLRAVILKAVEHDPALRYQTMAQFAKALDDYLEPDEAPLPDGGRQATLEL